MADNNVAIIDSGGANIASLRFALQRLQVNAALTTNPDVIRNASHVIVPGVGAAADAMQRLESQELSVLIPTLTQPVLGICLGLHLLLERSEEQDTKCLGIVDGSAEKLLGDSGHRVPNMGWSRIAIKREHELLANIDDGSYFYFLHSYALPVADSALATAEHSQPFTAILSRNNFHATQFHPERSANAGSQLLQNFLSLGA
jgi:glutamine amidotransferase